MPHDPATPPESHLGPVGPMRPAPLPGLLVYGLTYMAWAVAIPLAAPSGGSGLTALMYLGFVLSMYAIYRRRRAYGQQAAARAAIARAGARPPAAATLGFRAFLFAAALAMAWLTVLGALDPGWPRDVLALAALASGAYAYLQLARWLLAPGSTRHEREIGDFLFGLVAVPALPLLAAASEGGPAAYPLMAAVALVWPLFTIAWQRRRHLRLQAEGGAPEARLAGGLAEA